MNSDWPCPPNNAHSPCTCCKTKWQKHWPVLLRKKPNGPSTRGCSKNMERCGTHSDCSRTWANAGRNLCQTWTGGGIAAHSKQCEFTKDSKKYIELAATITYHYHYTVYTSVSINIFQKIQALAERCFFFNWSFCHTAIWTLALAGGVTGPSDDLSDAALGVIGAWRPGFAGCEVRGWCLRLFNNGASFWRMAGILGVGKLATSACTASR